MSPTSRASDEEWKRRQNRVNRFREAARSALDLKNDPPVQPESIVGDGFLVAGTLSLLYGKPGRRKTWAAMQLALAVARGEPWLGLPTKRRRVGYLSLELPEWYIAERLRALNGDDDCLDNVRIVARPTLKGSVDLLDRENDTGDALKAWIIVDDLRLLIIDPLSRVHSADENAAREIGQLLAELERIAAETGCHILIVHHEPKGSADQRRDRDHLDAARGSSRLQSDPTTLLHLHESRGKLCLTAAKVNLGQMPAPIYLEPTEAGPLTVCPEPPSKKEQGEETRAAALDTLRQAGRGLTTQEVADAIGKVRTTALRHLTALEKEGMVVKAGDRWHLAPGEEES